MAWATNQAGDAARDAGDPAAARALYERSLSTFRELSDQGGVVSALSDLARLARREGDLPRAKAVCREALALGAIGSQRAEALLIEEVAALAAASHDPRRALVLFAAAAGLRGRLGWPVPASERPARERLIQDQRAALGAEAVAAWSQGWRLDAVEAMSFARGLFE